MTFFRENAGELRFIIIKKKIQDKNPNTHTLYTHQSLIMTWFSAQQMSYSTMLLSDQVYLLMS